MPQGVGQMVDVRVFNSLEEAEPTWRRFEEVGKALPYQLFDWVAAWNSTNAARSLEPCPVSVSTAAGEPLFFLPIGSSAAVRRRIKVRTAFWLGASFADQQAPIVTEAGAALDAAEFKAAWVAVGEALGSVDLIKLRRQPDTIYDLPNPLQHLDLTVDATAYSTRLSVPWDEYFASKMGRLRRKNSRRMLRRLSEVGEVEYKIVTDPVEMERAVTVMIDQKRARYEQTGRDDFFEDETNAGFHRSFIERRPDLSQMMVCTLDGEIVATDWGVIHGSTFHGLMSTFDLEWDQFSPGRLLMERVMQWSCENAIEIYDFSIGDEPYKKDWCELSTPLSSGSSAVTLKGRGVLLPGQVRRAAEARLSGVKLPDALNQRLQGRRGD